MSRLQTTVKLPQKLLMNFLAVSAKGVPAIDVHGNRITCSNSGKTRHITRLIEMLLN